MRCNRAQCLDLTPRPVPVADECNVRQAHVSVGVLLVEAECFFCR